MTQDKTLSKKMPYSAVLLAAGLALALTACNTVEGAGEDIEAAGGAISDTADDTKEAITE